MTSVDRNLREPWDSLADQRQAAVFGMWTFIASELLFFGALFLGYAFVRALHPTDILEASRRTNIWFGSVNTAILITSSFTMVMATRAADLGVRRTAAVLLAATAGLGVMFLVLKGFEYRDDIEQGLVPGQGFAMDLPAAQLFFSFYWTLTGVHAVHLTIGIGLVFRLLVKTIGRDAALRSPQFEVTALYWGLVDIIWLLAYPLIYLGGRS